MLYSFKAPVDLFTVNNQEYPSLDDLYEYILKGGYPEVNSKHEVFPY